MRSHFNTDPEAKRILGLITGWMAEPKGARRTPLRRLDAAAGAGAHVVFAPLPSLRPTLAAALDTLRCLAAAPAGAPKVLWLRDWSGFCLNCVTGGKVLANDLNLPLTPTPYPYLIPLTLTLTLALTPTLTLTVTLTRSSPTISRACKPRAPSSWGRCTPSPPR